MFEVGSVAHLRAVLFVVARVAGLTVFEIADEAGLDSLDALVALDYLERLKLARRVCSGADNDVYWEPSPLAYRARI